MPSLQDLYQVTPAYPMGPVAAYAAPSDTSTPSQAPTHAAAAGNVSSAGSAPAFAWLATLAVYVLIRVLYEQGGRTGGPV